MFEGVNVMDMDPDRPSLQPLSVVEKSDTENQGSGRMSFHDDDDEEYGSELSSHIFNSLSSSEVEESVTSEVSEISSNRLRIDNNGTGISTAVQSR